MRYAIPYVDAATEIIPNEEAYEAVGQVRMVIPGETGCLICCGAVDTTEAALDLMTQDQVAEHAHAGYVRGTRETPTPSVLHLNGVTSHLAVSQMLRLISGDDLGQAAFLHYEQQRYQMLAAKVARDPACPVYGEQGYLGQGDEPARPADDRGHRAFVLSQGCRTDEGDESLLAGAVPGAAQDKPDPGPGLGSQMDGQADQKEQTQ